jgi:hypothetical protein
MKRKLFAVLALLSMGIVALANQTDAQTQPTPRVQNTVFVFNTPFSTNIGLGFCMPDSQKGCIESVSVGGTPLTLAASAVTATYYIGGGVYYLPCRFVATEATSCEAPYLSINRLDNAALNDVEVKFRRKAGSEPTSRIGTAIMNGALTSFEPAAPGVRDVATIKLSAVETHHHQTGSTSCRGWVIAIDACSIGDNATSKSINNVGLLLLPGMRSAVVPPDIIDSTCNTLNPTGNCIVNVFEDASLGGWVDTSASIFGLASTDRFTGAAQLKIAGPHFKAPSAPTSDVAPELNLSTFRMFMPSEYLRLSFGLKPSEANSVSLPVRRTYGETVSTPSTSYIPSASGLLVDTSGIGFSVPTVSVSRVLVVKKNQKITVSMILKAAGVLSARQFGTASIRVTKGSGMKRIGSRYSFSKTRSVKVAVKYKSTKKTTATRWLMVKVIR